MAQPPTGIYDLTWTRHGALLGKMWVARSEILIRIVFLSLTITWVAGCSSVPGISARGEVAGQRVATTVDSALARYYLEHYLRGDHADTDMARDVDGLLATHAADSGDHLALARLAGASSVDFAALYFVDQLYASPANRRAQQAFHSWVSQLSSGAISNELPADAHRYLLAFVPGFAYRFDPTTGADFARPRALLDAIGFRTVLIETDEFGSVEKNADIVAATLERLATHENRIVLVSVSKGGPEAAHALGERISDATSRSVKAWISIGGLLRGSPYADGYSQWPWRWLANIALTFRGLPREIVRDLGTVTRRTAFDRLVVPAHMLTLQYVGVPLSGHVQPYVRGRYESIRAQGPNDGLTLLADELVAGGIVITELGLDHYYLAPDIDSRTIALAYVVFEELARRESDAARSGRRKPDD